MKRIDRQTLWYLIWNALTFPPKSHKKADLISSGEFLHAMCDRICDCVDSDRFAVIDGGDSYMGPRDPLPERGDFVEMRTVRKGSPPPPTKQQADDRWMKPRPEDRDEADKPRI